MFLEVYDFFMDWLFSGGLPNFLSVDVAQWIAFGCACALILVGIIVICLPLIYIISMIFNCF